MREEFLSWKAHNFKGGKMFIPSSTNNEINPVCLKFEDVVEFENILTEDLKEKIFEFCKKIHLKVCPLKALRTFKSRNGKEDIHRWVCTEGHDSNEFEYSDYSSCKDFCPYENEFVNKNYSKKTCYYMERFNKHCEKQDTYISVFE